MKVRSHRTVRVDDQEFLVPMGIARRHSERHRGWKARRDDPGKRQQEREFSDGTQGPAVSLARAIAWREADPSSVEIPNAAPTLRQVDIGDQKLLVPTGISRRNSPRHLGWRASRTSTHGRQFREFSDGAAGPASSLASAMAWVQGLPVREPYDRIDLTPVAIRKITLQRRVRGRKGIRFDLTIRPSKSVWKRNWMTVFVGTIHTIDQARVDAAIALLHARWAAFRNMIQAQGLDAALNASFHDVTPAGDRFYDTRLLCEDVRHWTGTATGVGFAPVDLVDPARQTLFAPEWEVVAERQAGPVADIVAIDTVIDDRAKKITGSSSRRRRRNNSAHRVIAASGG